MPNNNDSLGQLAIMLIMIIKLKMIKMTGETPESGGTVRQRETKNALKT